MLFFVLALCFTASFAQRVFIVRDKDQFGVVDPDGKQLAAVEYDLIEKDAHYNFYYLHQNKKMGLMDSIGNLVFKCEYDNVVVTNKMFVLVTKDNKSVYHNLRNNSQSALSGQLKAYYTISGRYSCCRIDSNLVVVDYLNKTSFTSPFDSIGNILSMENNRTDIFSFYKDQYLFPVFKGKRRGVTDEDFKIVIPVKYDDVRLQAGCWYVRSGKTIGIFNLKGQEIISVGNYENLQPVNRNQYKVMRGGKCGICNKDGKLILPMEYEDIFWQGGNFVVRKNGKYGLVAADGAKKVKPEWSDISIFGNDLYKVSQIEKGTQSYGLMTTSGTILVKPKHEKITFYSNELFGIKKGDTTIFINDKGKELFQGRYSAVEYIPSSKLYWLKGAVSKANNWGVVNQFNQKLLDTVYAKSAFRFKLNEVAVKLDSSLISISTEPNGRLIEKIVYKNYIEAVIDTLNQNYWMRKKINDSESIWLLCDPKDKVLIPIPYNQISRNYLGNKRKTVATIAKEHFCVIDDDKAKILVDSINSLEDTDLKKNTPMRCYKRNLKAYLITRSFERCSDEYKYLGIFKNGATRVNKGGFFTKMDDGYLLCSDKRVQSPIAYQHYDRFMGGKWGVLDTTGRLLIECKYDFLQIEFKNKIIASLNGKWGVINRYDSLLIPFAYDEIQFFRELKKYSYQNMDCRYFKAMKGNKWGVIDDANRIVLDFEYQKVEYKPNEKGDFFVVEQNNKCGLLDAQKKNIIPMAFASIDYVDTAFCRSYYKVSSAYTYKSIKNAPIAGFMNSNLEFEILPQFYDVQPFENGYACILFEPRKYGFIDRMGNVINKEPFDALRNFSYGKAAIRMGNAWGFIDTTATLVLNCQYWTVGDFYHDIVPVGIMTPKKLWGLIRSKRKMTIVNAKGERVTENNYRELANFDKGFALARQKYKYGLIDSLGNLKIPMKFSELIWLSHYRLAIAKSSGKKTKLYQLTGTEFKLIGEYDKLGKFSGGMVWFVKDKKYGFIDSTGAIAISAQYDQVGDFSYGLAKVSSKGWYGFVDKKGEACPLKYNDCSDFRNAYAKVRLGRKQFYVNTSIDSVLPPKYAMEKNVSFKGSRGIQKQDKEMRLVDKALYPYLQATEIKRFDDSSFIKSDISHPDKYGVCNAQGRTIVPHYFKQFSEPKDGRSVVKIDQLEGVYGCDGRQIVPVRYLEVDWAGGTVVRLVGITTTTYLNLKK